MNINRLNPLKTFLLFILIVSIFPAFTQESIEVKGVKGIGVIAGRVSYEDARREALNNAKVEALRKAGVKENLQSYEMLFRSEVNNDFSEFFSSDIQAELQGAVQKYEVVNMENTTDPITKLPNVEVTINATVILYSHGPDPAFNIRIDGIKGIYEEGEELKFTVLSTQSCYLHIFAISDTHTTLMFPNAWEKFMEIPAEKTTTFPFEQIMDYTLYKSSKEPEINRILFVFTKDPVRYLKISGEDQVTSSEDIFAWVYGLMPDKRKIDYQVFTIR